MSFQLRPGFKLGVSTASTQIEGGAVDSNWNHFCNEGKTRDGSDVARSTDHYRLWREDADLLARLGIMNYRLSPEWARIEPAPGEYSEEALLHYRTELLYLKDLGISPLLTFYHFSHPMWFERLGGFTKYENLPHFLNFVRRCLEAFGDLVEDYVTINEPNVFAVTSYLFGEWPPERHSFIETFKVLNVEIAAHLLSYQLIHEFRKERGWGESRVSFAHHMRVFAPKRADWIDRFGVRCFNALFQDWLMEACFKAEFRWPLRNLAKLKPGRYVDFIAINYYSRGYVDRFRDTTDSGANHNDLGWEIYPQGLVECCRRAYQSLALPIVISENGTCDNEDRFRCRYIYDHLKAVTEAADLPIEAYYHWCFVDNFEWKEGESSRFGLVHCDYETAARTVKRSGDFYSAIIRAGGVSEALYTEYVAEQEYRV